MRGLPEATFHGMMARIQSLYESGVIRPIYSKRTPDVHDPGYVREVAEIKRLLERWTGDAAFRDWFARDPDGAGASLGLSIEPRLMQILWDEELAIATPYDQIPLPALRYRAFNYEKLYHRNEIKATDATMDPRYAAWRERQMRRTAGDLHPLHVEGIIHAPFCIELCNGCSVGCWFCAISAPKLGDIFTYTAENAALFRRVIEATQEIFGRAASRGFLYWATDPLDNPDYEAFMVDFHALTGVFPQTTSALALKDVARTRALLALSQAKGCWLNRFSLLSLKQLERVHAEFTPEELLFVELVLQNKENLMSKVRAGRAPERRPKAPANPGHKGNEFQEGTIACVSGFLINMVSRTVKLMSPCQASRRWPLGYIVFGEGTFSSAQGFRDLVHRLVDEHMGQLQGHDPVAFYDYLEYQRVDQGFQLQAVHQTVSFDSNPAFAPIGSVLRGRSLEPRARPLTVDQVVDAVLERARDTLEPAEVWYALQLLHDRGVLDTLPPPPYSDVLQVRL